MSKNPDIDMKSQLNRHINSKLFRRFLNNESLKVSELSPADRSLPPSIKQSPDPIRNSLDYSDDENYARRSKLLNKSISQRDTFSRSIEKSSIFSRNYSPQRNPFVYKEDEFPNYRLQIKKPAEIHMKPRSSMYTVDPLLLKRYEETQSRLKDEIIQVKEKYEGIIKGKNNENKRLIKAQESLKSNLAEMQKRIEEAEDNERKLVGIKAERDVLVRKIHGIEAECENYRRQYEHAKDDSENFKTQIDEYERLARNKTQDLERDLRNAKDRAEEFERQAFKEQERTQTIERKFSKAKERLFYLENELTRAEDRNKRLERELQETKELLSKETNQQIRETEHLRRKIEDLAQELMKTPKNNYEPDLKRDHYEPRNSFNKSYNPKRDRNEIRESLAHDDDRWNNFNRTHERKSDPSSWQMKEVLSPRHNVTENHRDLESKLMNLQLEKKQLEDESAKIPILGKRIAQIKRQQEIDLQLEILNVEISAVKSRLRKTNAL